MGDKRLPPTAYDLPEGEQYVPYTHGQTPHEFTLKSLLIGALLGMLFGGANTYLGLKAGLTISTSIPIAVLTVVAFRLLPRFGRGHSILELNMSQTVGSASSSVASGVLFTIPALYLWGQEPEWLQLTLLATSGGLLGVLAMIPLRRYLIKQEHGRLPYPEGMACAEVLVATEGGGRRSLGVFWGLAAGILVKSITGGVKLFSEKFSIALPAKAGIAASVSPALVGVGYILGPRVAGVMVAGGALSALVIIPLINLWGQSLNAPFYPETELLIRDMSASDIWNRYVRYIGAGAVATGGILTLIQSIPTMLESFRIGIRQLTQGADASTDRHDDDLDMRVVVGFVLVILGVLVFVPGILGYLDNIIFRAVGAVLIAVFAFFFVTVSSRIVGLVGVTSNPTSGMTIATLIMTSLVFYALGWTDMYGKVTALMVGTSVCIAASIAGDTSQDLKTGFILGATPRLQQIGEMLGVLTSAGVVCFVIGLLDRTAEGGLGGSELPAPQGTLMQLVIDGVLERNLPWSLIFIGVGLAVVAAAARVPVLAFAVGVYLPLYTMAAVFVGGLLRKLTTRKLERAEAQRRREQGVLVASGMVGGEGLAGVLLAILVVARGGEKIHGWSLGLPQLAALEGLSAGAERAIHVADELAALAGLVAIAGFIYWQARRRIKE